MSNARNRRNQLHAAALKPRRSHGPVGVQLTAGQASMHGLAYDGETGRSPAAGDEACRDCGFHVCNCNPGYEPPESVDLDAARAMGERAGRELAAESGLAAGWTGPSRLGIYRHASGAAAWKGSGIHADRWLFATRYGAGGDWCLDGEGRDEAMARALGWHPEKGMPAGSVAWWVFDSPHGLHDRCHRYFARANEFGSPKGRVARTNPDRTTEETVIESLPHAIAWAMNHDQPAPAAEPAKPQAGGEVACPKGWRRLEQAGSNGQGLYWSRGDYSPDDGTTLVWHATAVNPAKPWRARAGKAYPHVGDFANFHAACMFALGADVVEHDDGSIGVAYRNADGSPFTDRVHTEVGRELSVRRLTNLRGAR